uniref:Uncharacterized protein n=1 Tax=Chelonoidis abingdonii TaxID=106734 RepID=A0A8C0G5Q5_CHEAB
HPNSWSPGYTRSIGTAHCSLEFLSSSDPLASASPGAGITGTSHWAWLILHATSSSFNLCL